VYKDANGGLTFYVQNESPGEGQRAKLASCTERAFRRCDAPLLAEAGSTRWYVEASANDQSS